MAENFQALLPTMYLQIEGEMKRVRQNGTLLFKQKRECLFLAFSLEPESHFSGPCGLCLQIVVQLLTSLHLY